MMTHEQFARLARSVFGHGCASAVAALGGRKYHRSTGLRWMRGEIPIPDDVAEALKKKAAHRLAELQRAVG